MVLLSFLDGMRPRQASTASQCHCDTQLPGIIPLDDMMDDLPNGPTVPGVGEIRRRVRQIRHRPFEEHRPLSKPGERTITIRILLRINPPFCSKWYEVNVVLGLSPTTSSLPRMCRIHFAGVESMHGNASMSKMYLFSSSDVIASP
jgi:hypothetical protein